ncbi:hypothetical protein JW916_15740 [Candidatus Sumerlaeota bacterium]|nr:hypothetical protein [Candidatus Sumerlaeota bacterium]
MRTERLLHLRVRAIPRVGLSWLSGMAILLALLSFAGSAAAQGAGGFDMGKVLGGEGGSFDVLRADRQEFETDEDTGDVVKYTADGKFRYRSKDFDLDCDHLVYTAATNLLVATGSPCKIRKDKTNAECRLFEYETKENRMVLKGDPYILDERDGQIVKTWAKKITFARTADGRSRTILDTGRSTSSGANGNGSAPPPAPSAKDGAVIDIQEAPTPKPPKTRAPSTPVRIDNGKLDKIPAVGIDE